MLSKILGSLAALAAGDAMGMPTEFMTPVSIREHFGTVSSFRSPCPVSIHPDLRAGQVTDDTEQVLFLLRQYMRDRAVTPENTARALMDWAIRRQAFEKSYLGPSSRRALERLFQGQSPRRTGLGNTSCGAAMRACACALVCGGRMPETLHAAVVSALPTHGSPVAVAGACAIAAATAEALTDTATVESIIQAGLRAAREGRKLAEALGLSPDSCQVGFSPPAHFEPGSGEGLTDGLPLDDSPHRPGIHSVPDDMETAILAALELVKGTPSAVEAGLRLYEHGRCGMESAVAVPAAFALFSAAGGRPMEVVVAAANSGGDTDSIAAMGGSIAGALAGVEAVPEALIEELESTNSLDLGGVSREIVETVSAGIRVLLPTTLTEVEPGSSQEGKSHAGTTTTGESGASCP